MEQIILLREQGLDSQTIANELQIDKEEVDLCLVEHFYNLCPNPRRTNLEIVKTIIRDRHNNMTLQKCCEKQNVSFTNISKLFKNCGIRFANPKYFDMSKITSMFIQNLLQEFDSGVPVYKLVEKFGYNKDVLARIINANGRSTTITFDIDVFDTIDTEEKAYWLGFLYADGCVSDQNQISLELKLLDAEHLHKFKTFLQSSLEVKLDFGKLKRCRFSICNVHTASKLGELGCVPRKSFILEFPNENKVPPHLQIPFIRGYFDGDGSLSYNFTDTVKTHITVSTSFIGTKIFLEYLENVLSQHDIFFNWYHDKRHNDVIFTIDNNKSNSVKLLNLLYTNSNIHLDRKYLKYLFFQKHKNFAVQKSDFLDYNRAISEKAKQWINNYYKIDFDAEYANAEITKGIQEPLES